MQNLLLILAAAAVFCCAMLAPSFKSRMLRPRVLPRRLVILPVGEDCERLEAHLLYERDRARQDGKTTLFLFDKHAGAEACEIARHFSHQEQNILCGSETELRKAIGDDAVYKVVEIVLY